MTGDLVIIIALLGLVGLALYVVFL